MRCSFLRHRLLGNNDTWGPRLGRDGGCMSTNFDASWADSARQFQQMVGEGWSQMLQVLQPKEMGR
ncbi:hypothetical protein HMPREF0298_0681, partial [Corynebacterium lipophiloflavum DSM 44291]